MDPLYLLGNRSNKADRGSQYVCQAYQRLLADHGIRCRISRQKDCLDKAVTERFFGRLKGERIAHRYHATRQEARANVFGYIRMFYNIP
jgi:putative transposase